MFAIETAASNGEFEVFFIAGHMHIVQGKLEEGELEVCFRPLLLSHAFLLPLFRSEAKCLQEEDNPLLELFYLAIKTSIFPLELLDFNVC